MNISWHGFSCFEITTKTPSGEVTIVTDPYDNSLGLRFPRTLEADIVTVSHKEKDATNTEAVGGEKFIINSPGEYEIKGVFVSTIDSGDNLITRIESENITLAHLGALKQELNNQELEALQNVDILMIPVGGGRVIEPKKASEVISQIEPRVVIPMTHGIAGVKEKLESVDTFCKELRVCRREEAAKYKVSRKDLPEDEMVITVLTR